MEHLVYIVIFAALFWILFFGVKSTIHVLKTSRIRKDPELCLLHCTAWEAYRAMGPYLDRSPSWREWAIAISLGAMEKCIEENGIPPQRIAEVMPHVLAPIFSESDGRRIAHYYLGGDQTSAFHRAVDRSKRFLQQDIDTGSFPDEVASTKLTIKGLGDLESGLWPLQ